MGKNELCHLSPSSFESEKQMNWKIFRIMAELVEGLEFVTGFEKDISILGTKSIMPESPYYSAAYKVGKFAAEHGYSVITGGKYGIAEAANKGAFEVGGNSIGIGMEVAGNIELNSYLTKSILFTFPFTRKFVMTAPSDAFVFFPGGFGTMHQLFEVLTLIQTKKMKKCPIILYNREFWEPLHQFIKKLMVHNIESISREDDELYHIADSEQSVIKIIKEYS